MLTKSYEVAKQQFYNQDWNSTNIFQKDIKEWYGLILIANISTLFYSLLHVDLG